MAQKLKPCYDRYCEEQTEYRDEPFVIRFRNPKTGSVVFDDVVRGTISIDNTELDDLVIARSDGVPTYNFSVVVDDIDMAVTHVIRGSDHINNTPRQINIYKALGKEPPIFAHLPMILDEDGTKLSKRQGAAGVLFYRDEGYLPEALLNYLVRLGWSHGDQEIFSTDEMIRFFDLKELHKSPACINPKKLDWLNQHYMKSLPASVVAKHLNEQMVRLGIDLAKGPDLTDIVTAQAERCKTLKEMAERSRYFYEEFDQYDEEAVKKHVKSGAVDVLKNILEKFKAIEHWKADKLHQVITDYAEKNEIGMGKIGMPLRVAITGGAMSPSVDVTLELIGKERVISRIEKAIKNWEK
jgi:glutamyl-tRNA synthetase